MIAVMVLAMIAALSVQAQETYNQSSLSTAQIASQQVPGSADRYHVTENGCINQNMNDFFLITDSGNKLLLSGNGDFASHVGNWVRVDGVENFKGHALNVDRINMVADTCANK